MGKLEMTWDEMKRRISNGASVKVLAELNGVSDQTIYNFIKRNKEAEAGVPEMLAPVEPVKAPKNSRTIDNGRLNAMLDMATTERKILDTQLDNLSEQMSKLEKKIKKLTRELDEIEAVRDQIEARRHSIGRIEGMAHDFVCGTVSAEFFQYVSKESES